MLSVAVIGYGYWGPNVARAARSTGRATISWICDVAEERLKIAKGMHPEAQLTKDIGDLVADPDLDAVVVTLPVSEHFKFTMQMLKAGKHVLVTKPAAQTTDQVLKMIHEAQRRDLVLMVDHTFVYSDPVRKIADAIDRGEIGKPLYYDSVRVNLGLFQSDVNALWDLAVHDLSILLYVLKDIPCEVSATGAAHVLGHPENMAFVTLFFESGLIAHVTVNWLAPVKIRHTLIGGDKKMIVYNDLEPSEKIKIYDKGLTLTDNPQEVYKQIAGYRTGDMYAPKTEAVEPLHVEINHFIDCITSDTEPETGGLSAYHTVAILEAASKSITENGRPQRLDLTQW